MFRGLLRSEVTDAGVRRSPVVGRTDGDPGGWNSGLSAQRPEESLDDQSLARLRPEVIRMAEGREEHS